MYKIIYFYDFDPKRCNNNQIYADFLDYAFATADFFMLTYINYYGKGYSATSKSIMKQLMPYKVKSRTNPQWPGTLNTCTPSTSYKIVFYRTDDGAKSILDINALMNPKANPSDPQDIAFFRGNECWFYSVRHENIKAIIRATKEDLNFVAKIGLASQADAKPWNDYYTQYDERILP